MLGVALLVLLVLLVPLIAAFLDKGDGSTGQSSNPPADERLFARETLVYLESVGELPQGVNPMAFRKQLAIPKVAESPQPGGGVQPPKPGGGTVAQPARPGDKPSAPDKKEPPWVITVKYRGLYKGITGKEMAFIDAKNSKGNKQAQNVGRKFYLPANGRVFNAMTVRSFDGQRVVLSYGKGKEVALELGKEKKVTIDE